MAAEFFLIADVFFLSLIRICKKSCIDYPRRACR
jgi:hypothetical protein